MIIQRFPGGERGCSCKCFDSPFLKSHALKLRLVFGKRSRNIRNIFWLFGNSPLLPQGAPLWGRLGQAKTLASLEKVLARNLSRQILANCPRIAETPRNAKKHKELEEPTSHGIKRPESPSFGTQPHPVEPPS